MALFIIGLVLLALCMVCIAIAITKTIVYKATYKVTDLTNPNQDNIRKYITFKRSNIVWEPITSLIFGYIGVMFTCCGISDVREHFVKQYDDHIYEWNQSAYVNDSGEVRVDKERYLMKVKEISDRETFYLKDTLKVE